MSDPKVVLVGCHADCGMCRGALCAMCPGTSVITRPRTCHHDVFQRHNRTDQKTIEATFALKRRSEPPQRLEP